MRYQKLSNTDIKVSQLALAWCLTRPFLTAAIIGATAQSQLEQALDAVDLVLTDDVMGDIQTVYRQYPIPF